MPRLSICIATLNRADFIGETLKGLLSEAPPDVEVVILDGGSADGTGQICVQLAEHYPQIRYVRQDRPNGVDADFDRAVQLATGDYCWLMSDDDLLKPGAIDRVLKELQREPDLVIVNAEVRTPDMSNLLASRVMKINANRDYGPTDTDSLFVDAAGYLSFIGGVVIRRSLWNQRARERYYGSLFIHVGVIFQAPLSLAVVIAEPLVIIRYGNALWAARGFEIWMLKWPELLWSFDGISDASKQLVSLRHPWHRAKTILFFRAKQAYSRAVYRRLLRTLPSSGLVRARALAVAICPAAIAYAIAITYLRLRHPDPSLALFELRRSRGSKA